MRSLLCFTILTASSLAFEKPEDSSLQRSSSLPEIDYSKVKPIEQSKAVKSAEIPTQSQAALKPEVSSAMPKPKVGGQSSLPWLGVLGDPLSDPMKAQLGLEHGLVLKYVVPDSPAAKAGLEVYDIIQSVNGEPVSNQLQLKEAITSLSVDDCIKLAVRSKGEKELVKVTLCHKPKTDTGVHEVPSKKGLNELSELERLMNDNESELIPSREIKRGFGGVFGKILKEITPNLDINFESTSSVIIQDDSGSVEVQTINGSKNVIVKGGRNEIEFEGAWNTEEDFAKAPAHIKERIDRVGSGYKNLGKRILGQGVR